MSFSTQEFDDNRRRIVLNATETAFILADIEEYISKQVDGFLRADIAESFTRLRLIGDESALAVLDICSAVDKTWVLRDDSWEKDAGVIQVQAHGQYETWRNGVVYHDKASAKSTIASQSAGTLGQPLEISIGGSGADSYSLTHDEASLQLSNHCPAASSTTTSPMELKSTEIINVNFLRRIRSPHTYMQQDQTSFHFMLEKCDVYSCGVIMY